jgi:hypothetical protein
MKTLVSKLFLLILVFAAVPALGIQPVYKEQASHKPNKIRKISSVLMKIGTGDIRAVLPHKKTSQPTSTIKGIDPRFVIIDNWSGRPTRVGFEDGSQLKPNYLSRGAMLGLKIGGGIVAGVAALLSGLAGVTD